MPIRMPIQEACTFLCGKKSSDRSPFRVVDPSLEETFHADSKV
jgi:hypothetical protein